MILTSPGNGAASDTRVAAGGGVAEADAPADAAASLAEKMDLQAIGVSQLAITRKKIGAQIFFDLNETNTLADSKLKSEK